MSIFERLRTALPKLIFYPPASPSQMERVEKSLRVKFPNWLRELYLHSNGITASDSSADYLLALECNDDFPESLLSWNQFLRDEWVSYLPDFQIYDPKFNESDILEFLFIGTINFANWAIKTRLGPQIIWYNVRDVEHDQIFAGDFALACIQYEKWLQNPDSDLFARENSRP